MKQMRRLNGYVLIYKPDHPSAIKSGGEKGYVYEHVLVAEKATGKKIPKGYEVHHLDFNRANNVPNNLIVLSYAAHQQLHCWLRKGAPIGLTTVSLKTTVKPVVVGKKRCAILVNRCNCGKPTSSPKHTYCSSTCYNIDNQTSVSKSKLKGLIDSGMPWTKIGIELGVSDNGARVIARRLELL
jgi:hypothetical protein